MIQASSETTSNERDERNDEVGVTGVYSMYLI
jgi:hypothetical protein